MGSKSVMADTALCMFGAMDAVVKGLRQRGYAKPFALPHPLPKF